MSDKATIRHLLVIEEKEGRRVVGLDAATYSIGRDPTSAIMLDAEGISRQHAILLRVPTGGGYCYRILDGNAAGKLSKNGLAVNRQKCTSHELLDGDQIVFAGVVKAHYYQRSISEDDYERYTQTADFRSIKADVVDPRSTVIKSPPPA